MRVGQAAVCFILRDQEILLMQAPWAENRWSVIGGKLEPGKAPDEAVRREVWEETGLTLTDCEPIGHLYLDEGADGGTSLALFRSRAFTGELRGSPEGEPSWHALSSVGALQVIDLVRLLLPLVLDRDAKITGTVTVGPGSVILAHSVSA